MLRSFTVALGLISTLLVAGCVTIDKGPTAPSITKVERGQSLQEVENALGGSRRTYRYFGFECRIYFATTMDRQEEKEHYVLFREERVVQVGEGGTEEDCFQSVRDSAN